MHFWYLCYSVKLLPAQHQLCLPSYIWKSKVVHCQPAPNRDPLRTAGCDQVALHFTLVNEAAVGFPALYCTLLHPARPHSPLSDKAGTQVTTCTGLVAALVFGRQGTRGSGFCSAARLEPQWSGAAIWETKERRGSCRQCGQRGDRSNQGSGEWRAVGRTP